MKPFAGSIMQMAYIADDLEAAVGHWQGMLGVGPFHVADGVPYEWVVYRGRPLDLRNRVAIAYSGDLQIELIQQVSSAPSIFTEFRSHGGGPHHVGALSEDFAAERNRLIAAGAEILQEGRTLAGVEFAYFDTVRGGNGAILELVRATPGLRRYFDKLKAQAAVWPDRDFVR